MWVDTGSLLLQRQALPCSRIWSKHWWKGRTYQFDIVFSCESFPHLPPPFLLQISHEFALNGNPQNPYCVGIPGVVEAYHNALRSVRLWGPTNVAPIISHVTRFAEQAASQPNSQVTSCYCKTTKKNRLFKGLKPSIVGCVYVLSE